MKNFDYAKKYHYMLKYVLLALPILIILLSIVSYNSNYESFNSYLDMINGFVNSFKSWSINSWYDSLLDSMNIDYSNSLINILTSYPLYCLWVYILDLILDILALIPRLAHKFINKFGGDY